MDPGHANVGIEPERNVVLSSRHAVLVAAVACAVGLLTVDGGFVYDDRHAILQSPVVQGQVGLWDALVARDFWGLPLGSAAKVSWRPGLPLIWRGLWPLGGGSALLFRVLALFLHAGTAVLAWALLRRWFAPRAALWAALLFACHPVHAEAVGGLVGNADIAASASILGALLLVDRDPRRAVSASLLVALGCVFKESAILGLPLIAIALAARRAPRDVWGPFVACAAIVATAVLGMVARAHAGAAEGASDNVLVALPVVARLGTALALVWRGARVLVWPDDIAPNHSYGVYDADALALWPWSLAGGVVFLGFLGLGLRALGKRDVGQAVLVALCAGPILAGSNLFFVAPTEFAERLLYASALAPSAWVAAWLDRQAPRASRQAGRVSGFDAVAFALVCACAGLTVWHQRPWRSQQALFTHAVEVEPRSWRNQHNLGDALAKAGEVEQGLWHVMLGAHLKRTLPRPVDWRVVEALDLLPVRDRLLTAPAALATSDACGLIDALVVAAWPGAASADDAAKARAVFAQRYLCSAK